MSRYCMSFSVGFRRASCTAETMTSGPGPFRQPPLRSAPLEHGHALLDERFRSLAVVLGQARVHVVRRLEVEALLGARAFLRAVQVLLHVPVGDGRAGGETRGQR